MKIALVIFMKNNIDHLTKLILDWQESGEGYSELFEEASKFVIEYPRRFYNWDPDSCSDFYLFFYKRLVKLIEGFEYRGISFKALLKNTISWQMTSFYHRSKSSSDKSYCLRYDNIIQAESAFDSEPPRCLKLTPDARKSFKLSGAGKAGNPRLCKRLLMLTLKNAYYIDDSYIERIAELTGCSRSWLEDAVQELRLRGEKRRQRLETYEIRANKAYLEICRIHRELGLCLEATKQHELRKRLRLVRTRMRRACRGKNSVLLNPTNREIAEVMGIPKGSIDSGLYLLRKELSIPAESGEASNRICGLSQGNRR